MKWWKSDVQALKVARSLFPDEYTVLGLCFIIRLLFLVKHGELLPICCNIYPFVCPDFDTLEPTSLDNNTLIRWQSVFGKQATYLISIWSEQHQPRERQGFPEH
ncbi:hypothetical protein XPA_000475 [Xanthoria parietina]